MTEDLKHAIATFNRKDYLAAGEMFEQAAASAQAELKAMVRAFNQIAAAFHLRFERGGRQSAINLLSQAMLALEDFKPVRDGMDIDRLCRELSAFVDDLRASPKENESKLKHRARIFIERRRAPKIEPAR